MPLAIKDILVFILISTASSIAGALEVSSLPCANNASYPVHLTFDDGPKIPETMQILDTLKQYGIKATFLISASHFPSLTTDPPGIPSASEKKMIALIQRMQAEGHQVGSHSYDHIEHANLAKESAATIEDNLKKNFNVLKGLKLSTDRPFRFPYGSGWFKDTDKKNQAEANSVMAEIKEKGFTPLHWDIDSWDWSKIKRKALPNSILHQICSHHGGVVLMHDIQPTTAATLSEIIQSIQRSGHKLVSYDEIKAYSKKQPLASFADQTAGIFYCHRSVGDLDEIWPNCDAYINNSYDTTNGVAQ